MKKDLIFICYQRNDTDQKYLDEIYTALKAYGKVPFRKVIWYDKKVLEFDDKWKSKIKDAIGRSCIAVCLISNSFFGSEVIRDFELPEIVSARKRNKLKICNVHVSSFADFPEKLISQYQSVNEPCNPLDLIKNRGELRREIDRIVSEIAKQWTEIQRNSMESKKSRVGSGGPMLTNSDKSEKAIGSGDAALQLNEIKRKRPDKLALLPNHVVEEFVARLRNAKSKNIKGEFDIAEYFNDEIHDILKDCVLLAKARYNYQEGKSNAMQDKWSKSITKHLLAYTFFSSLSREEYNYLVSRSAGRLAWGLLMNKNSIAAKFYLEESEKYDQVQAAGNYFWAIQYALRVNDVAKAKNLAEKYVDICLGLYGNSESFRGVEGYSKIDEKFAINFVKKCYQLIIKDNQSREDLSAYRGDQDKMHSSDAGKLELLEAQLCLTQNKYEEAIKLFKKASRTFERNTLRSYADLCEIQAFLIDYLHVTKLSKKREKIGKLSVLFDQVGTSITTRNNAISVVKKIAKINILFLDTLRGERERIVEAFQKIVLSLDRYSVSLERDMEQLIIDLRQLIINIKDFIKESLSDSGESLIEDHEFIKEALTMFHCIYDKVPYLLENYEPILIEVLRDRFKKQQS
ncbi:MAG: toll/interleukin-1 receptor domain-containing protein [Planctomycetes bacterium]|nr:toll/interleukin-1 receptor domain-containing protein [Planctomycetota bacterium]